MEASIDLSISIVSYNTVDLLEQCLNSIYSYTSDSISFEVIVVDNASKDGSADMVRVKFPKVQLIVNEENRYFSRANNQAVRKSEGRNVLILNSDTSVRDNVLVNMVRYLDAHPEVGAIVPMMVFPDGRIQLNCARMSTWQMAMLNYTIVGRIFPRWREQINKAYRYNGWDRLSSKEVELLPDSAIMIPRRVFEKVGLYDEDLLLYWTEDELCRRIRQAGWKLMYVPIDGIIHHEMQSVGKENQRKIGQIYWGDCVRYHWKWDGWYIGLFLELLRFCGDVLRALKRLLRL